MSLKDHVKVSISGIADDEASPAFQETWTLGLKASERFVTLTVEGEIMKSTIVHALRHR
jgi:hypothetical protein